MPQIRLAVAALTLLAAAASSFAAEIPVAGRVLGPGGTPIPDVQVLLLPVVDPVRAARLDAEGKLPDPAARGTTTAQGFFRLDAPKAGSYRVRVEVPGFAPRQYLLAPLLEAADLPDVVLSRDAGLTVRVADRSGAPIEGASVRVADPESRYFGQPRWGIGARTYTTGNDGSVRLPRAEGDRDVVSVGAPGRLVAERRGVRGDSLTVKLDRGQTVAVEVRSASGDPVPGVLAQAGATQHPLGTTDASGRVAIAVPAGGSLEVLLAAPDGRSLQDRLSPPPPSRPGPVRLALPERATLAGRVIDLDTRRPLALALVWKDAQPWEAVSTDDAGGYAIGVVGGDDGAVLAGASGYLRSEPRQPSAAAPGKPGPTFALTPAAAVEGDVVDPDGRPVAGAEITISPRPVPGMHMAFMGSAPPPRAITTARGRFRLSPVDASPRYDLKVRAAGFASASREVAPLAPKRTVEVPRVELARGRTAFGTVVDASKQPVQGAEAVLHSSPRRGGPGALVMPGDESGPEERSSSTGMDGRFEIGALAAGTFDLEIRKSGFARKRVEGIDIGEGTEPADLGETALAPGARLQGRVASAAGKPVDGAEISIVRNEGGPMRFRSPAPAAPDAVTSADGWFTIPDLARGDPVSLSVTREGYLEKRASGIEVPGSVPLEIVLHPSSKVSGTVVGPDGKPVGLAQVTLTEQRGGGVGGQMMMMIMRRGATADAAGRFVFDDVAPGRVSLGAKAQAFQEAKLDGVEVQEGRDVTGLELPMKPGAIVEGRVLAPDGRPAIGAEVGKVEEQETMVRFRGNGTDGDGNYRIEGVPPGKISIEATHESWARVVKDIEARPGTNTLDLQFQGGQDVSGRVVDAVGAAVAGARVGLRSPTRFQSGPGATSEADGSFRFEGVGDGDYEVKAAKSGLASPDQGTPVHVAGAPVAGIAVKLEAAAVLSGTVSGLEPDRLAQVEVRAVRQPAGHGSFREAGVDRQGRFRLADVGPGSWRLTAYHIPTGQQARGDVTVDPGAAEATVDLRFGGGLALTGRVVQGDSPVAGADLFVRGTDIVATGRGRTDGDGRFTVAGLEAGSYQLELNQWESGLFHEETFELTGPKDLLIKVPTSRVSGRVVDAADRRPVQGARVSLAPQDGAAGGASRFRLDRSAVTDLEGRFTIGSVADGAWRLTASAGGYAAETAPVAMQGGRDVENVKLLLDPTDGISLDARLPSGLAPDEVTIAVLEGSGKSIVSGSFATGENGHVRISTVPRGSWELLVSARGSGVLALRASSPGPPIPVALPPACTLDLSVPALERSEAVATATVTGADGRPFRTISWYEDPTSEWRLTAGRVRIDDLPPGSWTVAVASSDGKSWRGTVETAAGVPGALILE